MALIPGGRFEPPIQRAFNAIERALQSVGATINLLDKRIQQVQFERDLGGGMLLNRKLEQINEGGQEKARLRIWLMGDIGQVSSVRARSKIGPFVPSDPDFDPAAPDAFELTLKTDLPGEYPFGYYEKKELLTFKSSTYIEFIIYNQALEPLHREMLQADHDTEPEFKTADVFFGHYDYVQGQWPLYGMYHLEDDDSEGMEYGFSLTEPVAEPADGYYTVDLPGPRLSGWFITWVDAEADIYVVFRAREIYSLGDTSGKKGKPIHFHRKAPSVPAIQGPTTGDILALTSYRYSTTVTFNVSGSLPSRVLEWTGGNLRYSDGQNYTINPGSIDLRVSPYSTFSSPFWYPNLVYLYFNPAVDANDILATTDSTIPLPSPGNERMVLIGVCRAGRDSLGRHTDDHFLYFVTSAAEPIISAPLVYAGRLETLAASTGTLSVDGQLTMGSGSMITDAGDNYRLDPLDGLWIRPISLLTIGSPPGVRTVDFDGYLTMFAIDGGGVGVAAPRGASAFADKKFDGSSSYLTIDFPIAVNGDIVGSGDLKLGTDKLIDLDVLSATPGSTASGRSFICAVGTVIRYKDGNDTWRTLWTDQEKGKFLYAEPASFKFTFGSAMLYDDTGIGAAAATNLYIKVTDGTSDYLIPLWQT